MGCNTCFTSEGNVCVQMDNSTIIFTLSRLPFVLNSFFNEQYSTHYTKSPDSHYVGFDGGVVYILSPHPRAGVSHVRKYSCWSNFISFPNVFNLLGDGILQSYCAGFYGITFESLEYGPWVQAQEAQHSFDFGMLHFPCNGIHCHLDLPRIVYRLIGGFLYLTNGHSPPMFRKNVVLLPIQNQ